MSVVYELVEIERDRRVEYKTKFSRDRATARVCVPWALPEAGDLTRPRHEGHAVPAGFATMREGFDLGIFFLGKPFTVERALRIFKVIRAAGLREKRLYERLHLRAVVWCRRGSSYEEEFRAEALSLGEGGMLFQSAGSLALGEVIEVEFLLPESVTPTQARCRVVPLEPPNRVAVRFFVLKPSDRIAIRTLVRGAPER